MENKFWAIYTQMFISVLLQFRADFTGYGMALSCGSAPNSSLACDSFTLRRWASSTRLFTYMYIIYYIYIY